MQRDAQIAAEHALKEAGVEADDGPQPENWEDGLLEPVAEDASAFTGPRNALYAAQTVMSTHP
ncbi:hypothetical protein ACFWA5_40270 [Streptomyces mirabilis]|uniref:hypothetical protein n=1 Tax=Streptomyces mirabilis TaxID=68239 RepID=UPI00364BABF2